MILQRSQQHWGYNTVSRNALPSTEQSQPAASKWCDRFILSSPAGCNQERNKRDSAEQRAKRRWEVSHFNLASQLLSSLSPLPFSEAKAVMRPVLTSNQDCSHHLMKEGEGGHGKRVSANIHRLSAGAPVEADST